MEEKSDPRRKTREQVYVMRKAGVTVLKIADTLGISTVRVYQHLEALREEGKKV